MQCCRKRWSNAASYACLQELRYVVWDTATRNETHRGVLPLSLSATLTWLAFSEQGTLCAMDSEG